MTAVYWEIWRRADYGERLIETLSADLTKQFGRGFGTINLWRMRALYQASPEKQILSAPMKESGNPLSPNDLKGALSPGAALVVEFPLPWTSYGRLLSVRRPEARKFYETEALRCGWTTRQLDRQINSQLYERIALSRNKAALLRKAETAQLGDEITPEEAIRDPFVLEFLDLKDECSESRLEEALSPPPGWSVGGARSPSAGPVSSRTAASRRRRSDFTFHRSFANS